ncbi:MAG: nucleotidyltransferase domain-containing protein [Candidatus Hydrogenedentota bacterium]
MPTNTDQQLLEQIRDTLSQQVGNRLSRIILYGSRATGGATKDSDFDILVVEKGPVSKMEESKRLRGAMRDFPHPLDVCVMSEEEFEETKNVVGGLAYPANKYGIAL